MTYNDSSLKQQAETQRALGPAKGTRLTANPDPNKNNNINNENSINYSNWYL